MDIGIVGHEAAKFSPQAEAHAKAWMRALLKFAQCNHGPVTVVSGGCHLGGVDIWAEEAANALGLEKRIHLPGRRRWSGGYRERNIRIAEDSEIVFCLVVDEYPSGYRGMRFDGCYHCDTANHVKSGGCWTARYALKLGKKAKWLVIPQQ